MLNFLDQIWVDVEADETQCYMSSYYGSKNYGKMIMSEMIYLGSYNLIGPKLIDGLTMATGLFVCGSKMQDGSRGTNLTRLLLEYLFEKKNLLWNTESIESNLGLKIP